MLPRPEGSGRQALEAGEQAAPTAQALGVLQVIRGTISNEQLSSSPAKQGVGSRRVRTDLSLYQGSLVDASENVSSEVVFFLLVWLVKFFPRHGDPGRAI